MKKITAYINTVRVHWLVDELEALGIAEIMVTEYFSPSSRISRMELIAHDDAVENIRDIIHCVGTTGSAATIVSLSRSTIRDFPAIFRSVREQAGWKNHARNNSSVSCSAAAITGFVWRFP